MSSASTSTRSARPEHQLQVLGRDPEARSLDGEHVALEHRARGQVAGQRSGCGGRACTSPRAPPRAARPCARRRARPAPRGSPSTIAAQLVRLEREGVVGPLHRAVEREVLLDEGGAERGGGDRHRDARACGPTAPPARRTRRASSPSPAGWPARPARDRPTCTASGRPRRRRRRAAASSASSISPSAAIPVEMISGQPGGRGHLDQRQVDDLERGDLQRGHAELGELGHRLVVERAGEELDAARGARGRPAAPCHSRGSEISSSSSAGRLVGHRRQVLEARRLARVDALAGVGLELDGVGARLGGDVDQLAGPMPRSRLWLAPTSAIT